MHHSPCVQGGLRARGRREGSEDPPRSAPPGSCRLLIRSSLRTVHASGAHTLPDQDQPPGQSAPGAPGGDRLSLPRTPRRAGCGGLGRGRRPLRVPAGEPRGWSPQREEGGGGAPPPASAGARRPSGCGRDISPPPAGRAGRGGAAAAALGRASVMDGGAGRPASAVAAGVRPPPGRLRVAGPRTPLHPPARRGARCSWQALSVPACKQGLHSSPRLRGLVSFPGFSPPQPRPLPGSHS